MKNKGLIIGIVIVISVVVIVGGIVAIVLGGKIINNLANNKNIENTTNATEKIKENEENEDTEKSTNILDDNDSYFILINGKKFFAGDNISDLKSVNYTISQNEVDEDVPANKYLIGAGQIVTSENKRSFDVTPYNPSSSSVKVPEAVIGGITISDFETRYDANLAEIEVYGGIKLGCTMEEVKNVFGEPSGVTEGSTSTTYRYESEETYRSYRFTFDKEGKVTDIYWQNLVFDE